MVSKELVVADKNAIFGIDPASKDGDKCIVALDYDVYSKLKAKADLADEMEIVLHRIDKACLCTRGTKGFDYGEKHLTLGKPEMGARWLTPRSMLADIIKKAKMIKGVI